MRKLLIAVIPLLLFVFLMARADVDEAIPTEEIAKIEKEVRQERLERHGRIRTEPVNIRGPKVISVVSLLQLKRLEDNELVIIDARNFEEYSVGHLEGAINLPAEQVNSYTLASIIPNKEAPVVVYCNSGESREALEVIGRALGENYSNIHYYKEGIDGWMENGFAVVTSKGKKWLS